MLQYSGQQDHPPLFCNMENIETDIDKIYHAVVQKGLLRSNDLTGPSDRMHLKRLCEQGRIKRIARGIYAPADVNLSPDSSMAVISLKLPKAVICLISALNYYDITTQVPWEMWIAIPHNSGTPKITEHKVKYVWYSDEMLSEGVDTITIDGVQVKIFNPAKTIADCFKYRNKIGMDICLEALQQGWQRRLFTIDDLWKYSKVCRVKTVIRPYLETLK